MVARHVAPVTAFGGNLRSAARQLSRASAAKTEFELELVFTVHSTAALPQRFAREPNSNRALRG
jgi:hypothetical protein